MTLIDFLLLLLVAGVCGSLGQALTGYTRTGCLVSIALGFVGALLGTLLASSLGMGEILALRIGGRAFPVVWSIVGAALFVSLLRLIRRPATQ